MAAAQAEEWVDEYQDEISDARNRIITRMARAIPNTEIEGAALELCIETYLEASTGIRAGICLDEHDFDGPFDLAIMKGDGDSTEKYVCLKIQLNDNNVHSEFEDLCDLLSKRHEGELFSYYHYEYGPEMCVTHEIRVTLEEGARGCHSGFTPTSSMEEEEHPPKRWRDDEEETDEGEAAE